MLSVAETYVTPNDRIISDDNWKTCGRNHLWANLWYYTEVCMEESRKRTKILRIVDVQT
jgi:hypothetical protein